MNRLITPIQVILGFLILGICGGLENNSISLTGAGIGIAACIAGIYTLNVLDKRLSARHMRKPRVHTTAVSYRDAA